MKHHLGIFLQFCVLVFLPMLIIWQLSVGYRVGVMAALTVCGIVVFFVATKLRES